MLCTDHYSHCVEHYGRSVAASLCGSLGLQAISHSKAVDVPGWFSRPVRILEAIHYGPVRENGSTDDSAAATGTEGTAEKFAPNADNRSVSSHLLTTGAIDERCGDADAKSLGDSSKAPVAGANDKWAMQGSNLRPPPCKGGALAN